MYKLIYFYRKKIFDNIINGLKGNRSPRMYELGLEFLRIYDGKFNYSEGHTVSHLTYLFLIRNI